MSENEKTPQPESEDAQLDDQDLDSVAGGKGGLTTSDPIITICPPIIEPCFPTYPIDTL